MRSRYDLAQDSTTKSPLGSFYKDIFTIPMQKFRHTETAAEYTLTKDDIKRQDVFINKVFNMRELDDIVLWLNNVGLLHYKNAGDELDIPSVTDVENFYYKYRV